MKTISRYTPRMSKKRTLKFGFGTLGGLLCLWAFAYVSTLFPYLGWGRAQSAKQSIVKTNVGSMNIGMPYMLLFEGQTAFFDYTSYSEGSRITFDLKPVFSVGYSDQMKRVSGSGSGRVEITVPRTGLYQFRHEPSLTRGDGVTHYDTVWGAI